MIDRVKHMAFIMDGNGRWATSRGLSRSSGHKAGYERIPIVVETCVGLGIEVISAFAWSTENWSRPKQEVSFIMSAITRKLPEFAEELNRLDVCFHHIGHKANLSRNVRKALDRAEDATRSNTSAIFNFAFNYGGRAEITNAVRRVVEDGLDIDDISEEAIASRLWTRHMPDIDVLVRTGKEMRISNFMLWQSSYADICFLEKYWPDILPDDIKHISRTYSR